MREAENMNSESTFLSDLSIDYYEFRSSDCCLIPICLLRSVSLSVPPPSPARQGTMCVPAYSIYTVPFHPAEEDTQRLRSFIPRTARSSTPSRGRLCCARRPVSFPSSHRFLVKLNIKWDEVPSKMSRMSCWQWKVLMYVHHGSRYTSAVSTEVDHPAGLLLFMSSTL